ncbi:Glycosyltransferase family 2 [uncultured virus]|nr:Glycosyltransferase family 2 [uncultured virus]
MVKNEAPVLVSTLEPYVQAGIRDFVIYDTGSTDETISIAREFFRQHGIANGLIMEDPFVDFATTRTRALRATEAAFPHACFMVMPDAEWQLKKGEALLKFCEDRKFDKEKSYLIRTINGNNDYGQQRLIRCRTGVEFVGVVHETLNQLSTIRVPDAYFHWIGTNYGRDKSRLRWYKDLQLLHADVAAHPEHARETFYLAQTYECLGDNANATFWYGKRAAMKGWLEENFVAQFRYARLFDNDETWDRALVEYLKAHAMHPRRAESLIKIAQHYYSKGEHSLVYLFAKRALEIPYPEGGLFVDRDAYDFVRHDLVGISAWYIGEYKVGEKAVLNALKAKPDAKHLHGNLKLYTDRKPKPMPMSVPTRPLIHTISPQE